MTEEVKHEKCKKCKCWRATPTQFLNDKGRRLKTCTVCRSRFNCTQCDYKCSSYGDLKKHIKQVHDKIRDIECPHCDYKCCTNSRLKQHIKAVHDRINDIECPQCDFKCGSNGDLKQHIKAVHDRIRDAECPDCDFKCCTNSHLKQHIKAVHDRIKDIECPQCDFKCGSNSNLKTHIKQVHDRIRDVECPGCNYKCCTNAHLKSHLKYHCNGGITTNKSAGEVKVQAVLDKYEIDYVFDGSHNNLRSYEDKGLVRFDFCISTHDKSFIFIEFDGEQHYKPSRFGSQTKEEGTEAFNRGQQNDRIKNEYCRDMGYPLLRIHFKNTSIEDTILQFFEDNCIEI